LSSQFSELSATSWIANNGLCPAQCKMPSMLMGSYGLHMVFHV